ncbi:hypothetical protein [Mycolicibacterium sp.]|uniref:hypothetical protein n=1 Tax=Mycolicibacterium sp. TaxID=2320850 RepID=UPI001A18CC1D|nr:hypothetical protein [Mycolicibacterium sp.]MBJ7337491.1 hypothetical protein [Mycolicibacterium sp.]
MTTDAQTGRSSLDRFDRDILKYMLLWAPHGDLFDEDVFPEFGMTVGQFRQRFATLVSTLESWNVDPEDRGLVEGARRYFRHCQASRNDPVQSDEVAE